MKNIIFSIIIPVYNHDKGLEDTLNSLLRVSFPRDKMEIIVADNNSTDRSSQVAGSFRDKHPSLIKTVNETTVQSSYAARNKALTESLGDIIVFIDADMSVSPDWLEKISEFMDSTQAGYVGFSVYNHSSSTENIYGKYDRLAGFPIEAYLECRHFVPTCCLAVKRDVFTKIGLFNPSLISSGDYEFGNRAYDQGVKQLFAKDITVVHPTRNNFMSLTKKAWRIGRGRAQVRKAGVTLHAANLNKEKDLKSSRWESGTSLEKTAFEALDLCFFLIKCAGFISETFSPSAISETHAKLSSTDLAGDL